MAQPVAFKYRAFISYSHADTSSAKWLHRGLEGFRIDKDLVGRETMLGQVPATLKPIFRDRDDFTAGHTLTEQTLAALDASRALIVICSPSSAKSRYVNEEIRLFKSRHPARPVVPLIVAGKPGDAELECFPPALTFQLDAEGQVTSQPVEVLAADAREDGDGKTLGLAKVVAGLLGASSDDVFRRAERERRRKGRVRNGIVAVLAFLVVAASGSAVYAWQQLKTNEAFLTATLKTATEIVDEAVEQAENYGVPRKATLALLTKAEGLFDNMALLGQPTPELRYQKAWMLIQFARNYQILGDTRKWKERAEEAHQLLAELATEKPSNVLVQRSLSAALEELGDVLVAQGDFSEAVTSYEASFQISYRLVKADPDDLSLYRNLISCLDRVNHVLVSIGSLSKALENLRMSIDIQTKLDFGDTQSQRSLAYSHAAMGSVLVRQDQFSGALSSYKVSLGILNRLVEAENRDVQAQSDLSRVHGEIANLHFVQGDLVAALESYQRSLSIREALTKIDPENALWQHELSTDQAGIGDVYLAKDELPAALEHYRASLDISRRLATADPGNAGWQRHLSLSHQKMGDLLMARADPPEALKSYKASLVILEKLKETKPDNIGMLRDLSVIHNKLGDVLKKQRNFVEALAAYREGLASIKSLLAKNDSNFRWQNDFKFSVERIGFLAYDFVLARGWDHALAASDEAIALSPDLIWPHTNRAHALLFLGREQEARAIYLQYRGRMLGEKNWETVILADFTDMRKVGITHPLMDEITKQFAAEASPSSSTSTRVLNPADAAPPP